MLPDRKIPGSRQMVGLGSVARRRKDIHPSTTSCNYQCYKEILPLESRVSHGLDARCRGSSSLSSLLSMLISSRNTSYVHSYEARSFME